MKKKKLNLKRVFLLVIIIACFIYIGSYLINKNLNNDIKDIIKKETIYSEFSNNIKFSNNNSASDYMNVEEKIIDVLNLYYKSIYYLKINDFSKFFDDPTSSEAYLLNKAVEFQVNTRLEEVNNLKLKNASYDLEFISIEKKDNNYEVFVKENNSVNFVFLGNTPTKMYNIENTFVFNEEYKLISLRRTQDFYSIFTENLENLFTNEDIDTIYNNYFDKNLINRNDRLEEYNYYLENKTYEYEKCDNEYDRTKALEYTKKYVIDRNLEDWDKYDDYGGNCQNFASQVLINGGIPMDTVGPAVWKYFGTTPDNSTSKSGRSASWTIVSDFYNYAKENEGFGLCAQTDVNLFYAESGDIIQVGDDGFFVHTIVVKEQVIKDDNVIDILVNSNTNDYENYPISAFISPEIRLIKINGWNN